MSDEARETPDPARLGGFGVALSHIDAEILSGRLTNGQRLPPERELATQLGVSRGAVREAIRVLQAQGILVSETGRGNGTRVESTPSNAIGHILRLQLALDMVSFADLTETRVALEKAAVASAARIQHEEALQRAEATLGRMHDVAAPDPFNELDTAFHVALAEAGDNHLMSDLTVAIRRAVHTPIRKAEHALADWAGFRDVLVADHVAMLAAVRAGDEDLAAARTEAHIRSAYATLLGQG
nr:FCD domain-containing protein [Acidipropionibacterium timonense]